MNRRPPSPRRPAPYWLSFGAEDVPVLVEDSVRAIEAAVPTAVTAVVPGAGRNLRLPNGQRAPGFDEFIAGWLHRTLAGRPGQPPVPPAAAAAAG